MLCYIGQVPIWIEEDFEVSAAHVRYLVSTRDMLYWTVYNRHILGVLLLTC